MLRVRLLGELQIEGDAGPIAAPTGRQAQALLAWLALNPGPHARGPLAARFWPDVPDASARANLRNALWILRTALGGEAGSHLVATRDRAGLVVDALWTDVAEFARLVREGRPEDALELGGGELLAGLDDEWVLEARDRHRRDVQDALATLARTAEERGELGQAIAWSRRRAALDPLSEDAVRDLMRRLAAAGDRSGALGAYARLRDRFHRELGMATSSETRALADRIRQERGPLPEHRAADAPAARPARPSSYPLPLTGRDDELALLEEAWAEACRGAGQVVLLAGEAGIGKTRLAAEIADRAGRTGYVARGAALDLEGAAPFAPWAELIRGLVETAGIPPESASWTADLARLAPGLEARLGPPPVAAASPDLERARLFEATAALVGWAAGRRPCLLVLEDVHAADAASLALLGYVGRRAADLALLVLMTRRDTPLRAEVDALLDRLRAGGVPSREIALAPLPPAEIARLVQATGLTAPADVEQVVGAADGNPLLAVESARALAAGAGGVPATLRASVRASAGGLDDEARTLAELAAVAGRELEPEELDALPVHEVTWAAVRGVEAGLLAVSEGRVGYRHELLREAMLADIREPRRAWLHERLAEAVGDAGGVRRAGEIARHLRLAGRHDQAVRHLVGAAADARAVGALPEAAGFLEEALRIREDDPETWLALGDVEAWAGHDDGVRRSFARAVELIGPARLPALARAHLRQARLWRGAICDPDESRRHYRAALDVLDAVAGGEDDIRCEALAGVAWCRAVTGETEGAEEALAALHQLVGRSRPGHLLAHDIGVARAHLLIRSGRMQESCGPLIAAADAARSAGRPDMVYGALSWAASAAAAAGDFERSLALVDRALVVVRQAGMGPLEALLESARANVLARLDRAPEAREAAARLRGIAERLDDERLAALAEHDEGLVELGAGEFGRAEALLAAALERGAPVSRPLARLARAEALALLGRPDEAEAELRATTFEPVAPSDFPDTLVARLTRVQGLVAEARGDRELAVRRLQEAARGWRRRLDPGRVGDAYSSALLDLGRPPAVGLVEPERELARIEAELVSLAIPLSS